MRKYAREFSCAIHAYVLMQNHVHLLATPAEAGASSRMMQSLGRCYVAYFNARHDRTGTLWEGRFKSCLVDSDAYMLACYRYIEMNPVRARLVARPEDFPWSSFAHNALGAHDALITPHATFLALGLTAERRSQAYRDLVSRLLPPQLVDEIRLNLKQQRALGRDSFRQMVEKKTRRFAGTRAPNRPRKVQAL